LPLYNQSSNVLMPILH